MSLFLPDTFYYIFHHHYYQEWELPSSLISKIRTSHQSARPSTGMTSGQGEQYCGMQKFNPHKISVLTFGKADIRVKYQESPDNPDYS
jgi:hypothetical protein